MVIAPVIPLKVVLQHLEGPLIASYQVSKQWCESTNRNCGLLWEKMWSLECADLTKGCCLSRTLVFICLVDNSSRRVSSASLWHCCSARHEVDFPVKGNIEIRLVQTPVDAWHGPFLESRSGCFGVGCDFAWVLAWRLLLSSAWKITGRSSCYCENVEKRVVTPKGSGLGVLFFLGRCFESELTSTKTDCWP